MVNTTKGESHQADQEGSTDNERPQQDSGKTRRKTTESEFDLAWNNPPNYEPKWPLTRAERIKELDDPSAHYDKTEQRDNIRAAKAWHAQFPPDQIVPEETICFVNGRRVDESEVDNHEGWVWEEGVVWYDYSYFELEDQSGDDCVGTDVFPADKAELPIALMI
ncbi:hypothetical protein PVAR5_6957 [Paecilomyces variotii No. 5]|uniref:Uncharacterized protein n=1 Tax=Byssochlamys spectabilis (strain No. 5 / NBRC 109023) TaxID=1356009 RepID=V5G8C6_BYSSN|nr:hypothetical protein PVAR5_6957 [Paecilomyces variotii No. 5]